MSNATRVSILFCLLLALGFDVHASDAPFAIAQLPGQLPGQKLPGQLPGPSSAPAKPATAALPSAGAALPSAPCCSITAVNKTTGIVTAREKSGSRTIEIKATPAQLQSLRVGQDIFANLETKKASLDGKTICCDLAFAAAAPGPAAPATTLSAAPQTPVKQTAPTKTVSADPIKSGISPTATGLHELPGKAPLGTPQPPAKAPEPNRSALPAITAGGVLALPSTGMTSPNPATSTPAKASAMPTSACCSITKIDTPTGMVTAHESAALSVASMKGREANFEFNVADAKQLQGLKVGQKVFVNHETGDVSLDGKTMCCKIKGAGSRVASNSLAPRVPPAPTVLPTVSAGAVQMLHGSRVGTDVPRTAAGSGGMLHLEGIEAIKAASGLSQDAKDFLVMHARTLPEHELDTYIVDTKAAEQWFKAHPAPASVGKAAKEAGHKKKKKGCNLAHMSTHCASNEISNAADDLTKVWRKAWSDTTAEVMRDWNMAQDCFADHTLKPFDVPVKFKETVQVPLPAMSLATVTLGIPVDVDVTAHVKLFYIPCLPFAIRPKTMGADGTMESGGSITATVNMTVPVKHTFPIVHLDVPMATVPIVVGPVPIAILTVSIYVDGTIEFDAKGKLNGKVKLESLQKVKLDFECSGHGCNLSTQGIPVPATAMESVKVDGRLTITPALYTALELSFNGPVFQVRAGPEPKLIGELYGCGAASGTQNTSGVQTGVQSYALTADLDWSMALRAEALAGTKKLTDRHLPIVKQQHLGFWDLAQSTGLIPVVSGSTQLPSGKPTAYTIKMPECYPFRASAENTMQYRVSWTGNASGTSAASTSTAGCTFQAAGGTCSGAPTHDTTFNLTWPAPGDYTVTVAPVNDTHGHKFEASRSREYKVRVGQ